ncbi:hypothetical protein CGCTS75_v014767 [Colletotrichum tropicale]|nr:hypothetical protein CGCTS75_v014767 [Colletotrichum tropicale]
MSTASTYPTCPAAPSSARFTSTSPGRTISLRGHRFKAFDLHRMKLENVVFDAPFWLDVETKADSLDARMIWYDTFFLTASGTSLAQSAEGHWDLKQDCVDGVSVPTGPHGKVAHWGAGHLPVVRTPPQAPAIPLALGDSITGTVKFGQHRGSPRDVERRLAGRSETRRRRVSRRGIRPPSMDQDALENNDIQTRPIQYPIDTRLHRSISLVAAPRGQCNQRASSTAPSSFLS